jgi:ppGpp synthetase/RelA/SpoT-type nucleotidyltranferase
MALIDDFLVQYLREYDYYDKAAQLCARQCELSLEQSGIRAIVTYRTKRPDRLNTKLQNRKKKKRYRVFDDIYSDIVDLAGVRIALYFPDDRYEVDKIINASFVVHYSKKFRDLSNPN